MNKKQTQSRLITVAVLGNLSALAVVSGIFLRYDWQVFPGMPTLRLAAAPFFIYISGILFGPAAGGAVGLTSDLLTFLIKPSGAYLPTVTISAAISGIIPGLFRYLVKKHIGFASFGVFLSTVTVSALNSVFFWLFRHTIWQNPPDDFFAVLFFPRIFTAVILGVLYAALIIPFLKLIYKNKDMLSFLS